MNADKDKAIGAKDQRYASTVFAISAPKGTADAADERRQDKVIGTKDQNHSSNSSHLAAFICVHLRLNPLFLSPTIPPRPQNARSLR
jgi:hypothetical protein